MTERRVSVRLVAVGGSQVKAELVEIGQTGAAALGRIPQAAENTSRALALVDRTSAQAAFRARMLAFQLNDVFVSLASGQNPLMVFIQQGSQIAQIYGGENGGVRGALRDLGGMVGGLVARLGPLAAVVGAGALAVAGMRAEIEAATGVSVTFGDTALAVWQVVSRGVWEFIQPAVAAIAPWFSAAWQAISSGAIAVGNTLINAFRIAIEGIRVAWDGGWQSVYGRLLIFVEDAVGAVVAFGDRAIAVFTGAYEAIKAIWGKLPAAIADFAYQAANGLIGGVEAMLNAVVNRINSFIETLNAALALLPEWATGEGGVRIGTLDPVELGRIDNPFAGSAAAAGEAAAAAFEAALGRTYVQAPDLGLRARGEAAVAAGDAAWGAFGSSAREMWGQDPLGEFFDAVQAQAVENALNRTAEAAKGAGKAAKGAGREAKEGAEEAVSGWQAAQDALAEYAARARSIGQDIGQALVSAFGRAEEAVAEFVRTGKLNFGELVTSLIADLAKLAARRFILGPLASLLGGALGNLGGGLFAGVFHEGGLVGMSGPGRMVPALAFAGAPRLHSGGWAGLRADEVPAILQRGERVLSRREAAAWARGAAAPAVNVTIMARDAESFRQSQTQVAADIARAVSLGRRGM